MSASLLIVGPCDWADAPGVSSVCALPSAVVSESSVRVSGWLTWLEPVTNGL